MTHCMAALLEVRERRIMILSGREGTTATILYNSEYTARTLKILLASRNDPRVLSLLFARMSEVVRVLSLVTLVQFIEA